jgi:hypothetical protein
MMISKLHSLKTGIILTTCLLLLCLFKFTNAQTNNAYANNMKVIDSTFTGTGYAYIFGIYSGDVNRDGSVDGSDFLDLDPSIQIGDGGYLPGDLNGDGAVDGSDFLIMDPNIQAGVGSAIP